MSTSNLGRAYIEIVADGTTFTAELTGEVETALGKITETATAAFGEVEGRGAAAMETVAAGAAGAAEAVGGIGAASEAASSATSTAMGRAAEATATVAGAAGRAAEAEAALGDTAVAAGAKTAAAAAESAAALDTVAAAAGRGLSGVNLLGISAKQTGGLLAGFTAYEMVKSAGDLESSLTRLVTTAGELPENFALVRSGVLDMAGQVGVSAQDLAQGLYLIDSANIHGSDSLTVLKAAAQGAKQENADLTKVVDAVTTSLHDFHRPASDAADVTSQLIAAVSKGKTTFDALTGAMHTIEPVAAGAGMNLAQTAGALAAMTASGMSADQAATNLASSIRSFAKPTRPMIDELNQLGLSANDLSMHLGERGIAGTLQIVSKAILEHQTDGKVLLDSMNQSKEAAQDADLMYSKLPVSLQKLADSYKAGTLTGQGWRDAIKAMPAEQNTLASSWKTMNDRADGFSQILKSGSPAVQTYIGALGKAVGTSEGLQVALQLAGGNAEYANAAIAAVGGAAAEAGGNIEGWGAVQKTFNQRMSEAWQGIKALGTSIGTDLLPVASKAAGWFVDTFVPALEATGHWLGDVIDQARHSAAFTSALAAAAAAAQLLWGAGKLLVVVLTPLWELLKVGAHLFGLLPGPVQALTLAILAFKAASAVGLFTSLAASEGKVVAPLAASTRAVQTFTGTYRQAMGVVDETTGATLTRIEGLGAAAQATFPRMAATTMEWAAATKAACAEVTAAYAEAKMMSEANLMNGLNGVAPAMSGAQSAIAGLSAAAGAAAKGGLGLLRSGLSGITSMLGGPFGVALLGGVAVFSVLSASAQHHTEVVAATQKALVGYMQTQSQGGEKAIAATQKLDRYQQKIDDAKAALAAAQNQQVPAGKSMDRYGGQVQAAGDRVAELRRVLAGAKSDYHEQVAAMSPLELAQSRLVTAQNNLAEALKNNPPNSRQVADAEAKVAEAEHNVAAETDNATRAQRSQVQATQDQIDKTLAQIDAARALAESQAQTTQAIGDYNAQLADGTLKGGALTEATNRLVDQVEGTAKAAADAAAAQAASAGATDTSAASTGALLTALQGMVGTMTGPAKDAVLGMIDQLGGTATGATIAAGNINALGMDVIGLPDGKYVEIAAPTDVQMKALADLGYQVVHLPNGHVLVTADTSPAYAEIQDLIHRQYIASITLRTVNPNIQSDLAGNKTFQGFGGAIGGIVHAYAAGGFELTPMSGGIAQVVAPNSWRVIGDRVVDDEAYIPLNGSARSAAIWAQAGIRMGLLGAAGAAGGGGGGGGARPIQVTYAPTYDMPPTASAEQVAALASARLARDVALGLGNGLFDEQ